MNSQLIGWLGLSIISLSFVILNTKWYKHFLLIDTLGTFIMMIYAVYLQDLPFIISNAIIACMLMKKNYEGGLK
jgi:lipid-A-disaccharide synthase-like uncharacterized protein